MPGTGNAGFTSYVFLKCWLKPFLLIEENVTVPFWRLHGVIPSRHSRTWYMRHWHQLAGGETPSLCPMAWPEKAPCCALLIKGSLLHKLASLHPCPHAGYKDLSACLRGIPLGASQYRSLSSHIEFCWVTWGFAHHPLQEWETFSLPHFWSEQMELLQEAYSAATTKANSFSARNVYFQIKHLWCTSFLKTYRNVYSVIRLQEPSAFPLNSFMGIVLRRIIIPSEAVGAF